MSSGIFPEVASVNHVKPTYGPWEENVFGKNTTHSLTELEISFKIKESGVTVEWTQDMWKDSGKGGSVSGYLVEGDPAVALSLNELDTTDDGFTTYIAKLKQIQDEKLLDPSKRSIKTYHFKVFSNEGYIVLTQSVRSVLYKHLNPQDQPPYQVDNLEIVSCPAKVHTFTEGENVEITLKVSGKHHPNLQVSRMLYSVEGETKNVKQEYQHIYPPRCFPCLPCQNVQHITVHMNIQKSDTDEVIVILKIEKPSKEDQGRYTFKFSTGQQEVQVMTDLVEKSGSGLMLRNGDEGVLLSSATHCGGSSVSETRRIGMTPAWPDMVRCTIFAPKVEDFKFLGQGKELVNDGIFVILKKKIRGCVEGTLCIPNPTTDLAGEYCIQVLQEAGKSFQLTFHLDHSVQVGIKIIKQEWEGENVFCIQCEATGSPEPKVDFYRSHQFIADKPADGPLEGGIYSINHETKSDGTVLCTMKITTTREELQHALFTCCANNNFSKSVEFVRIN